MKRGAAAKQPNLWIATSDLVRTPADSFCERLNKILAGA
jgi:hypothetical protein